MKVTFYTTVLILLLTGCAAKTSRKDVACDCCMTTYSKLDSAINCILQAPDSTTTADERLFLFAFVTKDFQSNQALGWNIINDKEIVDVAKKRYLLIIMDPNEIDLSAPKMTPELINKIKTHNGEPYFVIANQALYPFADWTNNEKKDIIINRLEVGDGP